MLKVHHLNNSRSQRILWLLEELGTPYEIVNYQRMEGLPLAPPELKEVHPLGKSPVITDDGVTIAESGAIVEYLHRHVRQGTPAVRRRARDDHWKYIEWMHYAEGSAMLPLLLALFAGMLGDGAAPLRPHIDSEIGKQPVLHRGRARRARLLRRQGSHRRRRADELRARGRCGRRPAEAHPVLTRYLDRLHARPAYKRALEKGGPYQLMAR